MKLYKGPDDYLPGGAEGMIDSHDGVHRVPRQEVDLSQDYKLNTEHHNQEAEGQDITERL